jgi:hypothetical protein
MEGSLRFFKRRQGYLSEERTTMEVGGSRVETERGRRCKGPGAETARGVAE